MKTRILILIVVCMGSLLPAQVSVRKDDQFYKRLVVQRMDLDEKFNVPYRGVSRHPSDQDGGPNGMVQALLKGLKEGKIVAYDPDDLTKVMTYEDVVQRMKDFEQALTGELGEIDSLDTDWVDDEWDEDFPEEEDEDILEDFDTGTSEFDPLKDLSNYESVVQWTEEWIFDKNRSKMVQQIKDIQLIWADPGGAIMEKYLAVFRWGEAKEVLADARWHNRHNDAAHLNLKQAFDMRMFHSYVINVSGKGVKSLWEAEKRRLELVEYEHHLWSY
ncbi:MAG: hypothetical protein MRZ79_22580 [Bacteroidia bacterium]|nr:hypothetical protein [Bacteroidia bacterium]